MRTLVWFRGKDLRVADHVPLLDAAAAGEVVPLFVVDPYFFAPERAAKLPHRMQYLVESLAELAERIAALGSRLVLVAGKSVEVVPEVAAMLHVDRVVAHRWSEPFGRERDRRIARALTVPFDLYEGETLAAPGDVLTGKGEAFSVFGPFARAFAKAVTVDEPRLAPRRLPPLPRLPKELRTVAVPTVHDLGVVRNDGVIAAGERAAHARLRRFLRGPGAHYDVGRDQLGEEGTSRLSQDLKFGTLTPRQVWHAADDALSEHPRARRTFLNELLWRELAYHVLWHRPAVLRAPFREKWRGFPWRRDAKGWRAWIEGTTGYPIVDASARQLRATGFVHNRARMISASFLTKHLLLDYRRGEAHYMSMLTDGDWASNNLGWQWSAGCGVDAQPWFRIFNPTLQAKRFDPDGAYVRRWLPELRGKGEYPPPIVDHDVARRRFLATAQGHLG